jgi:murein DD-endopeptidase MepM/ murein hydrolase activator NlpD
LGSVRYLDLSRRQLEEAHRLVAARDARLRRRTRRLIGLRRRRNLLGIWLLSGFLVGMLALAVVLWSERLQSRHQQHRLLDLLSEANRMPFGPMPEVQEASPFSAIVRRAQALSQSAESDRARLQVLELALRAYVDSTRHLIHHDNERVLTQLEEAGLDRSKLVGTGALTQTQGKGGAFESSPVSTLMEALVGERHRDALMLNNELRTFMMALPAADPMHGMRLTSSFGMRRHPLLGRMEFHTGTDYVSDTDRTVRASMAGTVVQSGMNGGYGISVMIRNDFGVETLYAHLASTTATVGERVTLGTSLGQMGNTGWSSGPHLHYEVRYDKAPLNPSKVLAFTQDVLAHAKH